MPPRTLFSTQLPAAIAGVIVSGAFAPAIAAPAADAPDDRLTVDAAVRVRVETMDGQFRPNIAASDTLVTIRSTLAASYDLGGVRIGGEILDTRAYGENKRSSLDGKDEDALEPLQAYVAVDVPGLGGKGDKAVVTAGRFTMDIGSERLVARTDYANVHQSYLGAMFDWRSKGKDRIVAFWTRPFSTLPTDTQDIHDNHVQLDRASHSTQFFGASATKASLVHNISAETYVYRLVEHDLGNQPTRDRHITTYGVRLRRAPKPATIDFELEGMLQRGHARATTSASDRRDLEVRASYVHAEAGWTQKAKWTPRIALQFDLGSGDGRNTQQYGRFDSLFGARRFDISPSGLYGPGSRSNIASPAVRAEMKPSKRLDLSITTRGLWLADRTDSFGATGVRDRTGKSGNYAGTQIELRARRTLIPNRLKMDVGADLLKKGRFLKDAPNAPRTGDTHYGYVELSATF